MVWYLMLVFFLFYFVGPYVSCSDLKLPVSSLPRLFLIARLVPPIPD